MLIKYRNLINFSIKGFGIYFIENNQTNCINFDIISSDIKEDSYATIRGFKFLREQEFFKAIERTFINKPLNYIIWSDCGKHFRNQNVLGYLFNELKEANIQGKLLLLFESLFIELNDLN